MGILQAYIGRVGREGRKMGAGKEGKWMGRKRGGERQCKLIQGKVRRICRWRQEGSSDCGRVVIEISSVSKPSQNSAKCLGSLFPVSHTRTVV